MKAARLVLLSVALCSTVALADPSGRRWNLVACGTACPMGTTCVSARCVPQFRMATSVDNTGGMTINPGLPYSTFLNRTPSAFTAWTVGHVSCNTSWNSVLVAGFGSPVGVAAKNGMDRFNNLIWLSGTSWTHLPEQLALTTTTYFTSNSEIFDADMELNNNQAWSDSLAANTFDMESVVIHEAGHFLGLSHTPSSTAVMYANVNRAESKRVLTSLDTTDVCTVYPGDSGAQGQSCTLDSECTGGRVCRSRQGGTAKICTTTCTSSTTCTTGNTCQTANTGMACLPQVGVPDQCKFCQTGGECSSNLCLRFDTGVTFCSLSCSDNAQCGPNYTCQMPEGFCVPTAMTCTNQCTTATECAAGYTCTGGTCTPRGDTGDPCTVSLICKACNVCTRESATSPLSYCRACCAGMGAGGFCNACPNTTCGSTNSCVALSTGASSVCLPGSTAPTTCQNCNNGACADGLLCVAGRCRSPCNPVAPGACLACYSLTNGGGACACADEIGTEGEPCGNIGNTLAACGAGLSCVGSTSTVCRARCDVNQANSCRTGQSCQLMNGVGVCVPGTEGSTCASCVPGSNACNTGLECYLGRCYEKCNVNLGNACSSCVQKTADGQGVCGCQDQISPENGPCGTAPEVHACSTGTKCIAGSCRARCDPMVLDACPLGTSCQNIGGLNYCNDDTASGGGGGTATGGGGGGGGGRTGGGTNTCLSNGAACQVLSDCCSGVCTANSAGNKLCGATTTDLGCGCGAAGSPLGALVFGIVSLLRRRRR